MNFLRNFTEPVTLVGIPIAKQNSPKSRFDRSPPRHPDLHAFQSLGELGCQPQLNMTQKLKVPFPTREAVWIPHVKGKARRFPFSKAGERSVFLVL